eukprot:7445286-Alexandrium_andersonii.AAC.1
MQNQQMLHCATLHGAFRFLPASAIFIDSKTLASVRTPWAVARALAAVTPVDFKVSWVASSMESQKHSQW